MVIELLLNVIDSFSTWLFNLLPDIPSLPQNISTSIDNFLDLIFNNVGIVGVFVDINLLKILLPLVVIIINFEHIYRFIRWIIRKIPFLNIS